MAKKVSILHLIIVAAIFIGLEVAALGMLRNSSEAQNAWISRGMNSVNSSVWGTTEKIGSYFGLRRQNDSLAAENFRLRMLIDKYAYESKGSEDAEIIGPFHYTPATIVRHSQNSQHSYLILDKGTIDNVIAGSGVITPLGVVGWIDAVSEHYSHVVSINNTETVVSARVGRDDTGVGTLRWDGLTHTGAILTEVPFQEGVEPGDTVYTSGYSSLFPADIPIGVTKKVKVVNGATFTFDVKLFQDVRKLRYVTITSNNDRVEIQRLIEPTNEDQQ